MGQPLTGYLSEAGSEPSPPASTGRAQQDRFVTHPAKSAADVFCEPVKTRRAYDTNTHQIISHGYIIDYLRDQGTFHQVTAGRREATSGRQAI